MSDASCQRAERNPGYEATPIGGEGLRYHSLDFIRTATRVTNGLPSSTGGARRRYPKIRDSSVLPTARVSVPSRRLFSGAGACSRALAPVLGRWRLFSGAGTGGTRRDVANSETQFVIIKPPFVRPATLLTDLGSRGNSCYSLTAYPRLQTATAPQFRRTTRKQVPIVERNQICSRKNFGKVKPPSATKHFHV